MVVYTDSLEGITPERLQGFFVGWPSQPTPELHLKLLQNSDQVILAIDEESGRVVGFITAITDHVLSAYIPFLEVLPGFRNQGVGRQLTRRMLDKLNGLYMVDLVCDQDKQSFYLPLGMKRAAAMVIRNRDRQSGRP